MFAACSYFLPRVYGLLANLWASNSWLGKYLQKPFSIQHHFLSWLANANEFLAPTKRVHTENLYVNWEKYVIVKTVGILNIRNIEILISLYSVL